jgi:hypothetical protein
MRKLFEDISKQPQHFGNISVLKTLEISAGVCCIHRNTGEETYIGTEMAPPSYRIITSGTQDTHIHCIS